MSQPSRALVLFCKAAGVPHELHIVHIARGEHKSPSYAKHINANKKVPAAVIDGVRMAESHTILRFIAEPFALPLSWYPYSQPIPRVAIDEYLDWHHTNLRPGCAHFFRAAFLLPKLQNRAVDLDEVATTRKAMEVAVYKLNKIFLKGPGATYLCGRYMPSIADLSAFCELTQLEILGSDFDAIIADKPELVAWIARMKKLPGYDDVHTVFNKVKAANSRPNKL